MRSNLGFALVSAGDPAVAVLLLIEAERDIRAPQMAKHNLTLALIAAVERERAVRLIRTDMGPTEAEQLAHDLERYAEGLRNRPAPPPGPTTRPHHPAPPPGPTTRLNHRLGQQLDLP